MDRSETFIPMQLAFAFATDLRTAAKLQPNDADEFLIFADLAESVGSSSLEFSIIETRDTRGLRYLAQGLAQAQIQLSRPIVEAARTASGWAAWSEFYEQDSWSAPFIERFANGDIIGPSGTWYSDKLILGLFIFGPNIFYPSHAHPAIEIYYVLSGSPQFQVGADQPFIYKPPGSIILHRSDVSHAIRTGLLPVFGVYAWRGELSAPSWYRNNMVDEGEPKKYAIIRRAR